LHIPLSIGTFSFHCISCMCMWPLKRLNLASWIIAPYWALCVRLHLYLCICRRVRLPVVGIALTQVAADQSDSTAISRRPVPTNGKILVCFRQGGGDGGPAFYRAEWVVMCMSPGQSCDQARQLWNSESLQVNTVFTQLILLKELTLVQLGGSSSGGKSGSCIRKVAGSIPGLAYLSVNVSLSKTLTAPNMLLPCMVGINAIHFSSTVTIFGSNDQSAIKAYRGPT